MTFSMGMIKRPNEGLEGKQVYFGSRSEEMQSVAEAKTVILEVRGSLLSCFVSTIRKQMEMHGGVRT